MKKNPNQLNEALRIINSERGQVFAGELEQTISEALIKVKGEHEADVESAEALLDADKQHLETVLNRILARRITYQYRVKGELLGGFRIQVGDWKLDATLVHQLDTMIKFLRS
ncbi:MAG: ATP synthase subunit delta [Candidatus Gottesmanbacteria bacterium GW2011_GWB1_43_11]|uniref:ATP synthase subunit delta n=1 Tax=Candidatus Gottesmanbacteria bacterium GW2011_GWB1_43_11 TaxID=1618446 RepID=A0A0G1CKN1_9BACT|nr:MAG: ATP synthase subunit delta [Candidatus Gottesmanbacteria bacterium GW2011_GWA2_42_16]KKS55807.1 MAG: ATP synthase subunit delta [Candidatus Gottesmanbacteria bacterium GW2011_GWA1_42_26]KKS82015.1 MAG: ATP synthase subunit delta [Candidatus Gottesmanbacteria bacterium GW2011_GWC1_43_10]KKS86375.1 MAG: ATP synthase subunit delta [Candidatus Gottesmanbacteria bacterium GW2011_GWB1_43_11]OGG26487.1 MAG: hypothetical protein A3A59_01970 [Candidatus Gottesmanbacteria bacterium RIFCSPLOWO2_01